MEGDVHSMEVVLMMKRTLAGLTLVLAATAFNSSPASAFGWCGWGARTYSPMAYFYAPRTYYRPRVRLYRPVYHGRAYYRPRVYRRAYYRPFVGRAYYRPGVGVYRRSLYRPATVRTFYRPGVRVGATRTRAFYRPAVTTSFGPGVRARYRGRLP
jgi:hypothetical protein